MLTPKLIARGAVFPPATDKNGTVLAWSNRKNGTRDIFLQREGETVQLTNDPAVDTEPALSPDGDILIWARREQGEWDLYQKAGDGIEPFLAEPGVQRKPQISHDGSTLVFEDRNGVGILRDSEREWLAPPEGTEVSQNPRVSHDGSRVFWERFDKADRSTTLWMRDQNGVSKPLLTPDDSWTGYTTSRNGRQLTYSVWTDKGEDLVEWELDTNERRAVANKEDVNESFPSVTEDGETTYYTLADFRGYPKVNTYLFQDYQGEKRELVTRDPKGRNLFGQVTPDGQKLHWMWIDDNDPMNRALYFSETFKG